MKDKCYFVTDKIAGLVLIPYCLQVVHSYGIRDCTYLPTKKEKPATPEEITVNELLEYIERLQSDLHCLTNLLQSIELTQSKKP